MIPHLWHSDCICTQTAFCQRFTLFLTRAECSSREETEARGKEARAGSEATFVCDNLINVSLTELEQYLGSLSLQFISFYHHL